MFDLPTEKVSLPTSESISVEGRYVITNAIYHSDYRIGFFDRTAFDWRVGCLKDTNGCQGNIVKRIKQFVYKTQGLHEDAVRRVETKCHSTHTGILPRSVFTKFGRTHAGSKISAHLVRANQAHVALIYFAHEL